MYYDMLHSSIVYIESAANDLINKSEEILRTINNILEAFEHTLLAFHQRGFGRSDIVDLNNSREEKTLCKFKEIVLDNKGYCDSIICKLKEMMFIVDSQSLNSYLSFDKFMQLIIVTDFFSKKIFVETDMFSKNLYGVNCNYTINGNTTLFIIYEEYRKIAQDMSELCCELLSQAETVKKELEYSCCKVEHAGDNDYQHSFVPTKVETPICNQYIAQLQIENRPDLSHTVLHCAGHSDLDETVAAIDNQSATLKIDKVQFSALFSNQVLPGKYVSMSIIIYEDGFQKVVEEIQNSYGKNVKKTYGGYKDVERGATIMVVLHSDDVIVDDNSEKRQWCGNYLNFEFAVKIPTSFSDEQILFTATIYINDIVATKLKLIVDCSMKQKQNISIIRNDITSAFVSYASQDRSRVATIIQGMKKVRSDLDIFFDVENLHSGDYWEKALKQEIENRDVLFLCWSPFARASKWVETEWKYALSINGIDSIEPVPLVSPSECPPPDELKSKHFNDKILLYQEKTLSIPKNTENSLFPCIVRCKTKEIVTISKSVFKIGREKDLVDFCIEDNPLISRSHANIIVKENQYYIVDVNSKNHTYVNGMMLESSVETAITNQTTIRLANEDFRFLLC